MTSGETFGGLVGRWLKYYGGDFNEYWGYEILYDAGDKYDMLESDVAQYLVPDDAEPSVVSVSVDFDDSEWTEDGYVWVRELDGSWLEVMLWTHNSVAGSVCIQYGATDFEGIFPHYRIDADRNIYDCDGEPIESRETNPDGTDPTTTTTTRTTRNSTTVENQRISVENPTNTISVDTEQELYLSSGMPPEWMNDE